MKAFELDLEIDLEGYEDVTLKQMLSYADRIQKKMRKLAREELSPVSAGLYAKGLTKPKASKKNMEVTMKLQGFFPTAIEAGYDAFDMKPGLLASPKAKTAADGSKYLIVPLGEKKQKGKGKGKKFADPFSGGNFRVVSTKSPQGSWQHPGLEPHDFFDRAIEELS